MTVAQEAAQRLAVDIAHLRQAERAAARSLDRVDMIMKRAGRAR
jgi:hypothetical protein